MSDHHFSNIAFENDQQVERAVCVSAVLDIIKAQATSGNPSSVQSMLNNLSLYADKVEDALHKRD